MERVAFAVQVAPDHEDELRATSEAFKDAFDDFAASRRELGLTQMEVWVQSTSQGPLLIFVLEGALADYFAYISTASGIDEWMRQNIQAWSPSLEDAEAAYRYPQSESLFSWALKP